MEKTLPKTETEVKKKHRFLPENNPLYLEMYVKRIFAIRGRYSPDF